MNVKGTAGQLYGPGIGRYFKGGDDVTINGFSYVWHDSDKNGVHLIDGEIDETIEWIGVNSIGELSAARIRLTEEYIKLLESGWCLIDVSRSDQAIVDLTGPLIVELRPDASEECHFYFGQFGANISERVYRWEPAMQASGVEQFADNYIVRRAIEEVSDREVALDISQVLCACCYVSAGASRPDYLLDSAANLQILRSFILEAHRRDDRDIGFSAAGGFVVTPAAVAPIAVGTSDRPFKTMQSVSCIPTTRPDGYLPDMTGFELQSLGSPEQGWHSLCPIRAGRDLAEGEVLSAYQVRERDGELLKIDYTAVKAALKANQWPADFARHLREQGEQRGLCAGGWTSTGELTHEGLDLRLWCLNGHRAFSTAPFAGNLVQALACNDEHSPVEGQVLCLQVRDLKTQHLYENHFFTVPKGAVWSKGLCEQLNRDSRLVRAGVLNESICKVTPADKSNAFWVPQCAELCVTLGEATWSASREVEGTQQALVAGQAIEAWVYDAYSHRLMDSFSWTPQASQCAAGKWLEAWAKALNASSLNSWLCAGGSGLGADTTVAAGASRLTLWQRGEGVRIFTTLPDFGNWVPGPKLECPWGSGEHAILVTLRHPYSRKLLGRAVFEPDQLKDQVDTGEAFVDFVRAQGWPQVRVWREEGDGGPSFTGEGQGGWRAWQPRCAEWVLDLQQIPTLKSVETQRHQRLKELLRALYVREKELYKLNEPGYSRVFGDFKGCSVAIEKRLEGIYGELKGLIGLRELGELKELKEFNELKWRGELGGLEENSGSEEYKLIENFVLQRKRVGTQGLQAIDQLLQDFHNVLYWLRPEIIQLKNLVDVALQERKSPWMNKYLLVGDQLRAPNCNGFSYKSEFDLGPFANCGVITINYCKGHTVFRLSNEARNKGYRIATCSRIRDTNLIVGSAPSDIIVKAITADSVIWGSGGKSAFQLVLDFPESARGGQPFELGHLGYLDDNSLWQNVTAVPFTPPAACPAYTASSPLCEDYGNTMGSEVFDAGGDSETGVDPRTGLFHAHYPVATLQGLRGLGPVCDLTLHYSPLRGNEAGLGDGWAWRFSSLDVRDRRLTLADGQTLSFTDEEWTQLKNGQVLKHKACFVRSNPDYSQFTLDLPSGRQEILSKPSAPGSDEDEPNDEFLKEIIRLLQAIKAKSKPVFPAKPSSATEWALAVLCIQAYSGAAAADYAEAVKKWESNVKAIDERIAYYRRPFVQLMPSKIVSPYGEALALSWKRQQGQFLLKNVKSGETELFRADYTATAVTMDIWPGQSEGYAVALALENYLLTELRQTQARVPQLLQRVRCGYTEDPTLDQVLYRLEELDGSVERVEYAAKSAEFPDRRPALPRATHHILLPGSGARNWLKTYEYEGSYVSGGEYRVITWDETGEATVTYGADHEVLSSDNVVKGQSRVRTRMETTTSATGSTRTAVHEHARDTGPVLSTVTEAVVYTANRDIQKTTNGEGVCSYRCYYQTAGANTLRCGPLVNGLPDLSCPVIPEYTCAPLMAEYQCDKDGNPQGLTLYGYRSVTRNGREVLETATIVTVEGIKATLVDDRLDEKTTWALTVADKAQVLYRINKTETTTPAPKTKTPDCKVIQWTVTSTQSTTVGGQNMSLKTEQAFEDNPVYDGLDIRTTCTTSSSESSTSASQEVTRERRSRYSRRCLQKTSDGVETHWQHDGLGRVIEQTRYRLKPGQNAKAEDAKPDDRQQTQYDVGATGIRRELTHMDGSQTWEYLDGLQRVCRMQWRRRDSDPFILLGTRQLQGLSDDDEVSSQLWDYLPGGQAVIEPGQPVELPGWQPWRKDLLDEAGTVEHGVGPHTLLRSTRAMQANADGSFNSRETLCSTSGVERAGVERQYDISGRLVAMTRRLGDQASTCTMTRDALGRVIDMTRPDGSVINRSYHGLSQHIKELKVAGKVIATQTVKDISTLESRKVGSRAYTFAEDQVTLPDNTVLDTTADGQYKAGSELLSSLSRHEAVTTLASEATVEAGTFKTGRWQHSLTAVNLPGRQRLAENTPRRTASGEYWQSLRGVTVAALRADGHWQRQFFDHAGRLLRSWHDHEDILHRYDDQDRLVERRVQARQAGAFWQVLSEYDVFDQETRRTFCHNGRPVFAQALEWRGDGKLLAKHSERAGQRVRSEAFSYDKLDRLANYACTAGNAEDCPRDGEGKAVKAQTFQWDALSNLTECVTTYADGKTRKQTFAYDGSNPTRLTAVTTGSAKAALSWNGNGYLVTDEAERKLRYNAGGQLNEVRDKSDQLLTRYAYDGYQRVAAQYLASDQSTRELRYDGDTLIGETWFDKDGAMTARRSLNPGLAEYDTQATGVRWLIDDPQVGIAGQFGEQGLVLTPLLPFGEGAQAEGIGSGYNGLRRDPVTGSYQAGNGYRCYHPGLCRYAQPDWLSPFGEGGINDYAHCPDPVNFHDPSGAIMMSRWGQDRMLANLQQTLRDTQPMPVGSRWRGIALSAVLTVVGIAGSIMTGGTASMLVFAALTTLSVASLALEVASVLVEDSNPELARRLGIASAVLGLASIGNFVGIFKQGAKLLRSMAKLATSLARRIQSGARAGLRYLQNLRRFGLGYARQAFFSARKAGQLPGQVAEGFARAARTTVDDALGALVTRDFAIVEKDWLLKVLTGKTHHVLTGWQARLYCRATQQPRLVSLLAQAKTEAITANVYRSAVDTLSSAQEADSGPAYGFGGQNSIAFEPYMRGAATA